MKDMTPQEKLAVQLRYMVADGRNMGVNERTIDLDAIEQAATLLSEHGGGGEAEPFHVVLVNSDGRPTPSAPSEYMRHPSGDGTIVRKDDPSRRLSVDEILAEMRGPSAPDVFAWFRKSPRWWDVLKDSDLSERPDTSKMLADGWIPLYAEAPPSAPVVDDAWKNAVLNALAGTGMDAPHDEPPHSILNRIIRWHEEAATDPTLSGVSAPVGVETVVREAVAEWEECRSPLAAQEAMFKIANDLRANEAARALTPPAAAPRVDGALACEGCGKLYRDFALDVVLPDDQWHAIQGRESGVLCAACIVERGSKLPGVTVAKLHFPDLATAASEDGLPEEIEAIVCPLEDDAAAMLERLPDDGTAHTMQAAAALIRRLAASGQGVEDAAIERAVRAHDREDAGQKGEPDPWADEFPEPYRSERMTAMRLAFKAAAAPTQEKGNA